jgi:hypothetical protein
MLKKYQIKTNHNFSFRHELAAEPKRILKLVGIIVVLVVVLLVIRLSDNLSSVDSDGCGITSSEVQVAAADLIVTGKVFAVIPADEMADVLIEPIHLYQGSRPDQGIIIAAQPLVENGNNARTAQINELHFASGQSPYLLYLIERSDGRYNTSRCDGSRLFGAGLSDEEQLILGDGLLVP